MRRHGIIALEPAIDHSLVTAAIKKKNKTKNPQKRKGMVHFSYICPEALGGLNHRGIHAHNSA